MGLMKVLMKRLFRRAAYRALVGRYLDRHAPSKGRFTKRDVDRILERTWRQFDPLLADANLAELKTLGNKQNVVLGVASLAMYRALLAEGVDKDYATELFTDVGWKIYEKWISPLRLIARLVARDPQKQMEVIMRIFLRYPFSRPGYQWEYLPGPDVLRTPIRRCAVHDYFKAQGEEEETFFRNSWCTLDFALAQVMTEGGHYERVHTLSAGDELCDMEWYGKPSR